MVYDQSDNFKCCSLFDILTCMNRTIELGHRYYSREHNSKLVVHQLFGYIDGI